MLDLHRKIMVQAINGRSKLKVKNKSRSYYFLRNRFTLKISTYFRFLSQQQKHST